MRNPGKTLLLLVAVAIAALSVWRLTGGGDGLDDGSDPHLVVDRVWLDHLPRNDKDTINLFVAITEEPLGLFQATSQWKGNFELFLHEVSGEDLRITYPQSGEKEKVKAKARTCKERDMDYCLELS